MKKLYRVLIYLLPTVLFFSYYPVIALGATDSMNLELSLPLIWLVIFNIVSGITMIKTRPKIDKKVLLVFIAPLFITLSILWSKNPIRGVLTTGILWLIVFAIINFHCLYKDTIKDASNFSRTMLKSIFIPSIFICLWCWIQCALDLNGIAQNQSLMCNGCTTKMFGFPHPNGFAIEPQFMGNLLLFPVLLAIYLLFKNNKNITLWILASFFTSTLFLTFSRGAIYSFAVAFIFLLAFYIAKQKSVKPFKIVFVPLFAFIFSLNAQGIFAELSHTNDTYISGISKALNHLSLGIININAEDNDGATRNTIQTQSRQENNESVFNGYIEESTNVRINLTNSALEVWQESPWRILFGVGIGGAGTALYESQKTDTPKEIVQNEYINLLLEIGIVGVLILIIILFLIFRTASRTVDIFFFAIIIAYGLSLLFFSGLPNALHIYLLPAFFFKNESIIKQKVQSHRNNSR